MYTSPSSVPRFTNAQIVTYFVTRTVTDKLPSSDFKSLNQSAVDLFRCGHVQHVEASSSSRSLWIRARCLPEMKKDRVYKLLIALNNSNFDIVHAQCECPAGRGPTATCKHIAALCYAFQNFCEHGMLPDFLTCTERLQQWNRPRARKVDPIPVESIKGHQHAIRGIRLKRSRNPRTPNEFDPRPAALRSCDPDAVDQLRADLLSQSQQCAFLTILVPSVEKALHDHHYCLNEPNGVIAPPTKPVSPIYHSSTYTPQEFQMMCLKIDAELVVSSEQRTLIEKMTRSQFDCSLWHELRYKRITGWKCGRILTQKMKTPALLKAILYPTPFQHIPEPIKWGRENEPAAREAYIHFMRARGYPHLTVRACGFIIHPQEGWLGASPDGVITTSPNTQAQGSNALIPNVRKPPGMLALTPNFTVFLIKMED